MQKYICYFGYWEPDLTSLVVDRLKPGGVFIDVGANIGYFTLLASKLVGPSGVVVAIEASPTIYARLKRNVELNDASNVHLINMAVSDAVGVMKIYLGPSHNLGQTTTIGGQGYELEAEVPSAPLSQMVPTDLLRRATFIKIDIEGGEIPVLEDVVDNVLTVTMNVEVAAELWPSRDAAEARRVSRILEKFESEGFEWLQIRNDYRIESYFENRSRQTELCRPSFPLAETTDLIFRKTAQGTAATRTQVCRGQE